MPLCVQGLCYSHSKEIGDYTMQQGEVSLIVNGAKIRLFRIIPPSSLVLLLLSNVQKHLGL